MKNNNIKCLNCNHNLCENNDRLLCPNCFSIYPIINSIPIILGKNGLNHYLKCQYKSRFPYSPTDDKKIISVIIKYLSLINESFILDIGCGEGVYSNFFFEEKNKVIGIDLAKPLLELAKINHPEIDFYAINANNMPFPDEVFDVIFCSNFSLYFRSDIQSKIEFTKYIFSKLKIGGIFIFSLTSNLSGHNEESDAGIQNLQLSEAKEIFQDFKILNTSFIIRKYFPRLFRKFILSRVLSDFSKICIWIINNLFFGNVHGKIIILVKKS